MSICFQTLPLPIDVCTAAKMKRKPFCKKATSSVNCKFEKKVFLFFHPQFFVSLCCLPVNKFSKLQIILKCSSNYYHQLFDRPAVASVQEQMQFLAGHGPAEKKSFIKISLFLSLFLFFSRSQLHQCDLTKEEALLCVLEE